MSTENNKEDKFKHRVLGFAVIIALIVLIIPLLVNQEKYIDATENNVPPRPLVQPVEPVIEALDSADAADTNNVELDSALSEALANVEPNLEIVEDILPPDEKEKNKAIATDPKSWYVQLASFSQMENAEQLLQHLHAAGFKAHSETSKNPIGNPIIRVIVGQNLTREQADALRAQLEETFQLRGLVVRELS